MIGSTFLLLDGIGRKLERRLWHEGMLTWPEFLERDGVSFISPDRKRLMDAALYFAKCELDGGNASYFGDVLERAEHWRLFERFRNEAVCLDIETNGLPPGRGGRVTVVGLYGGFDYKCFVRGENLSANALNEELSRYKYLITFFGSAFDIPFLRESLSGFECELPHFDLCFGARRLGLRGGLKKIEPLFGIERCEETRGMSGYDAVLLWTEAKAGSREALELLKLYNREDTVNLMKIAGDIYRRLRDNTGIGLYEAGANGNGRRIKILPEVS